MLSAYRNYLFGSTAMTAADPRGSALLLLLASQPMVTLHG